MLRREASAMRTRRTWPAALCAALIAAGCLLGWAGAAQTQAPAFYQISLNDALPVFSPSVTPLEVNGVIYVPYTIFDKNVTEVDLGVYASESRTGTQYTVTLYNLRGLLKFDLNANTCTGRDGENQDMRAIIRSGRVYVPASAVCSYFGLGYSLTPTEYGTLVRITNGSEYLKGEKFLASAANLMRIRYEEYLQSLNPASPTPAPTPAPVPTPTPARPADGEPPEESKREVRVYLAFLCGDGEGLDGILNTLERSQTQALFLFPPEALAQNAASIRRMAGSGHLVGLYTAASGLEDARADLEAGTWM